MSVIQYINANEFIEQLKSKGLVIVSINEYESAKEIKRKKLMKRKALSLAEIAENNLLPVTTKKGVNDWIISGKIKPEETYRENSGKGRVMVLTCAIKRLGYVD
ncbi:hypothetical protein [Flavobacterium johnsoniae]|uniref:Uncharacterized protein n=1 Tax=Flavobacterium johnsoniae TaxID=986 RepID=A0A1M5IJJ0_FLAJO|nr:hypothetical protein [Flavobacterium johnsoniae]SHG28508.1 hypothetical protein SAMN05444388_102132 [Flavobacterium johnsoniae]